MCYFYVEDVLTKDAKGSALNIRNEQMNCMLLIQCLHMPIPISYSTAYEGYCAMCGGNLSKKDEKGSACNTYKTQQNVGD